MPAKPVAEQLVPIKQKKSNPTCGTCCNTDPERVSEKASYCTILGQWCKKVDSHGIAVTVMPCNGKMHGLTVDAIRKKKGLPTLAEAAAAAANAPVEPLKEDE